METSERLFRILPHAEPVEDKLRAIQQTLGMPVGGWGSGAMETSKPIAEEV